MAKISCFIFDERYHGYYLHCRSPYPFADGTMMEISEQLKQEEAGLMSGRGLQGAPEDMQSFELYITQSWRRRYDKIYASLLSQQARHQRRKGSPLSRLWRASTSSSSSTSRAKPSKLMKASVKLNQFLKVFVENHDEEHTWKSITNVRWLNQFLQIPPEMTSKRASLFLPGKQSFSSHHSTGNGYQYP